MEMWRAKKARTKNTRETKRGLRARLTPFPSHVELGGLKRSHCCVWQPCSRASLLVTNRQTRSKRRHQQQQHLVPSWRGGEREEEEGGRVRSCCSCPFYPSNLYCCKHNAIAAEGKKSLNLVSFYNVANEKLCLVCLAQKTYYKKTTYKNALLQQDTKAQEEQISGKAFRHVAIAPSGPETIAPGSPWQTPDEDRKVLDR
ncbi:hypothetical protein B0O80DRAFT_439640 [Mortierella sp. GBAus27b]|nr:hypothetical protein B0O80DRAFT_439640 [Mortierella sp. GBAus27b]